MSNFQHLLADLNVQTPQSVVVVVGGLFIRYEAIQIKDIGCSNYYSRSCKSGGWKT